MVFAQYVFVMFLPHLLTNKCILYGLYNDNYITRQNNTANWITTETSTTKPLTFKNPCKLIKNIYSTAEQLK